MKSLQIRNFYSVISPSTGKYGPEQTPYLGTFHAVFRTQIPKHFSEMFISLQTGCVTQKKTFAKRIKTVKKISGLEDSAKLLL